MPYDITMYEYTHGMRIYISNSLHPDNNLVSPFSILLLIFWYVDHLRNCDSVQVTEGLASSQQLLSNNTLKGIKKAELTFAIGPSGNFPSHLSSTF